MSRLRPGGVTMAANEVTATEFVALARRSKAEEELASQLKLVGLPRPVREYKFAADRRWRFDFAWPTRMVALEVDGGVWIAGRHTRGQGFANDIEKLNHAVWAGWRVYRVTPEMVSDGRARALMERVLSDASQRERD